MPSSYSNNLRLDLMANGDQAGTWGQTTNTNLGTLLEEAIAGYVAYPCSGGTDTLLIPDGASGNGRKMYINLTGTGGGTVQVPVYTKLYFVENSTASAITFRTTTGTGISVPAAAKIVLVCDGVNIITATNYMEGATFPSPTLTGIPIAPTATAGTNTTQIATTAFVQATAITTIQSTLQAAYPVGSIYMSTVSTNPATLFGFGMWVAFGSGRVLIGDGSGYVAGATGGSADSNVVAHTHTATTTIYDPGHYHAMGNGSEGSLNAAYGNLGNQGSGWRAANAGGAGVNGITNTATTGIAPTTIVDSAGGSGTNANLQPYIVVYMWNRTS
jgi:hypothetical protein